MTELPRTYKRPVEEAARAWFTSEVGDDGTEWLLHADEVRADYRKHAIAIMNRLRELGFISELGYAAIRAEEDANGWEHKVLPRYAPPPEQETR